MKTVRTIAEVRDQVAEARRHGRRIGFIPTMGFLHEGHLSLVDEARAHDADYIVVSIFVNPTQFGPHEDFEKYPRDEERDSGLLLDREVDLLFAPAVDEIFPGGATTSVSVGSVSEPLEGERRPGHFSGVATVVLKLFNIVGPDVAVFGQKDAQQCAVVRRMVRDLNVPVTLVMADTKRDSTGLALSSRNSYLSPDELRVAPALHQALQAGRSALASGSPLGAIDGVMQKSLEGTAGVDIDYLQLVDAATFCPPSDSASDLLLLGAVRVGRTRLIDNLSVTMQPLALASPHDQDQKDLRR